MRLSRPLAAATTVALALAGTALASAAHPGRAAADPTSGRGSAAVGSTSYPLPASALYVSPGGSDTSPGTSSAPLQTLTRALAVATNGATIVLRGGTYHESVTVRSATTVTIENYPGEAVWLDGSVPVTGWQQQGSAWVHAGWTTQFDSTAGYDATQAAAYQWLRPDHPMAAHPDMVFQDGVALQQVGSAAAVVPGTFYADYANAQIVVGSDPTGHEMRASTLQTAMLVKSANTVVRGIGIRAYATSVPQNAAVNLVGPGDRMENCVVTDNAAFGLHPTAAGQAYDHLTVSDNGLGGIGGNMADRIAVTNSVFDGNNSEYFNYSPVAAGIKLTRTDYPLISNDLIENTNGNGLWFDTSSFGVTVVGTDLLGNERSGLQIELSASVLIADDTATGNGYDGIRICDTGNVRIWNDTLVGNLTRNLDIAQDTRVQTSTSSGLDPRRSYPDPSLDWVTRNVDVEDTVLAAGGVFHAYYQDDTGQSPAQRNVVVDHDLFSAPAQKGYSPFAARVSGTTTKYALPSWTTYTGSGGDNVLSAGTTYAGMSASLADTGGTAPLPSDIAAATGLPAGQQVWGSS